MFWGLLSAKGNPNRYIQFSAEQTMRQVENTKYLLTESCSGFTAPNHRQLKCGYGMLPPRRRLHGPQRLHLGGLPETHIELAQQPNSPATQQPSSSTAQKPNSSTAQQSSVAVETMEPTREMAPFTGNSFKPGSLTQIAKIMLVFPVRVASKIGPSSYPSTTRSQAMG